MIYVPPPPDASEDIQNEPSDVRADPVCEDQFDGDSCALPNAAGVCVAGRCQLVVCELGFANCDSASVTGCESDVRTVDNCGACSVVCEGEEVCSQGPDGFVCAASTVCPGGRFSLTNETCNWRSEWSAEFALIPSDLQIEATGVGGTQSLTILAGTSGEARIVLQSNSPIPLVVDGSSMAGAAGTSRAVEVIDGARVLWSDGISTGTVFTSSVCAEVDNVAAVGDDIVTSAAGFRLGAAFSQYDYIQAFFPWVDPSVVMPRPAMEGQFEAEEVASCSCLWNGSGEPLVGRSCLDSACEMPASDCLSCAAPALNCPDFEIQSVLVFGDDRVLVTRRGFVKISGETLTRRETGYDPNVAGGFGFVGADAISATSFVAWRDDDSFQVFSVDALTAISSRTGFLFEGTTRLYAGSNEVAAMSDGARVLLSNPTGRGTRTIILDDFGRPQVSGLSVRSIIGTVNGFRILYVASGRVYVREIAVQ